MHMLKINPFKRYFPTIIIIPEHKKYSISIPKKPEPVKKSTAAKFKKPSQIRQIEKSHPLQPGRYTRPKSKNPSPINTIQTKIPSPHDPTHPVKREKNRR